MRASAFVQRTSPERVRELIDFAGGLSEYKSLVTLQSKGVAALFNRLCDRNRRFAYLADEVGMGKTYQALGVASLLWAIKPEARVVFVSPRKNLQEKWERDFDNFFRGNFLGRDGIGCSRVKGQPAVNKSHAENLREFALELRMPGRHAFFLRMSSFTRPLFVSSQDSWEDAWAGALTQMKRLGLSAQADASKPRRGQEDASWAINLAFGEALRGLLESMTAEQGSPAIDLLVLDEAQSLRNPGNQTNTVLRNSLADDHGPGSVVDRWLFLSATPIHGGRDDIHNAVTVANPGYDKLAGDRDERRFRESLKTFMVRRPRTYEADRKTHPTIVTKTDYRDHLIDDDRWIVRDMDAESALAMAVVQKRLVEVLEGKSNRFKIGYLSSFESLHDSLRRHVPRPEASGEEGEADGVASVPRSDHENVDQERRLSEDDEPPDAYFVQKLSDDYLEKFKRTLPHAKLDRVVSEISKDACESGTKYLVFARRINTVEELAQRFEEAHENAIVRRMLEHWREVLDWERGFEKPAELPEDEPEEVEPEEDREVESAGDGTETAEEEEAEEESVGEREGGVARTRTKHTLRTAFSPGAWLGKYRQTFRARQRNALVFQENWFLRLCEVGDQNPRTAARRIPDELWREADVFARRGEGRSTRRFQYIVIQALEREPEIFGLDERAAQKWREFFRGIYPRVRREEPRGAVADVPVQRDEALLLFRGFWEHWRETFGDGQAGIGADRMSKWLKGDGNDLAMRQCVTNWIGQSLRLSDALLDLYCAERKGPPRSNPYDFEWLSHFFSYLAGGHPHASALRKRCFDWASHFDVIRKNCFEQKGSLTDLARKGVYAELNAPAIAVRVVGGSPQPQAVKQFKMPYYPLIIVCTDVLKEGEDLHVFCDRVVHYGVAWTSGDLEQRVGRVDRFFSQIERRLADDRQAKLSVPYPHVYGSIERRQVLTVRNRVRASEILMGDLQTVRKEAKEIDLNAPSEVETAANEEPMGEMSHPFDVRDDDFDSQAPSLVGTTGERIAQCNPDQLHKLIESALQGRGAKFEDAPGSEKAAQGVLHDIAWETQAGRVELRWDFVPELSCYALTARQDQGNEARRALPGGGEETFGAYYESIREGERQTRRLDRLVLPNDASEKANTNAIDLFLDYVENPLVTPCRNADRMKAVRRVIESVDGARKDAVVTDNKVMLTFNVLSSRKQAISVYVYDQMVLVSSIACRLSVDLIQRLTGNRRKKQRPIEEWIAEQNAGLRLGFLHHHRPGTKYAALCLCERIFHTDLELPTLKEIVRHIAVKADGLEVFLAEGRDKE